MLSADVRIRFAVFCLLGACAPTDSFILLGALPGEVELLGVLLYDERGDFTGASGLVPQTPENASRLVAMTERAPGSFTVVGYRRDQLPSVLTDEVLAQSALRLASVEDVLMPKPIWIGEASSTQGEELQLQPSTAEPQLSADWLGACASILEAPGQVVDTCFPISCGFEVRQTGCRLTIEDRLCNGVVLEGTVGPRGRINYDVSAFFGTCASIPAEAGGVEALECSGGNFQSEVCRFEVLAPRQEAKLEVSKVVLSEEPLQTPSSVNARRHLSGIALQDEALWVVRHERPATENCSNTAGSLVRIDAVSLAVQEQPAPRDCITMLESSGSRLFAVVWGPNPELLELDAQGQVLTSTAIPALADFVAHDIAISSVDAQIGILMFPPIGAVSHVMRFSLDDLRFIDRLELPEARKPSSIVALQNGGFVTSDRGERLMIIENAEVRRLNTRPGCGQGSLGVVHERARTGELMVTARSEAHAMMLVDAQGDVRCRRLVFFEGRAEPFAQLPWPGDPELVLVGLDESPSGTARLALLDLERGRFLQESVEAGIGPVRAMVAGQSAVWASLPWEGAVLRVTRGAEN